MNSFEHIVIADHSPLMRLGIKAQVSQTHRCARVEEVETMQQLDQLLQLRSICANDRGRRQALLLIDSRLPGFGRYRQLQALSNRRQLAVAMLVDGVQASLLESAQRNGVEGVIDKSITPADFDQVVRALAAGKRWYWSDTQLDGDSLVVKPLSTQQARVYELLRAGLSNKQIAADLRLTESTVKHHVTKIFRKTNLAHPNRVFLAREAGRF